MRFALIPILLAGSGIHAGSLPDNLLSAEGRLSFGITDRVAGADAYVVGDATAKLRFDNIGAELGVFGRADALDTPHETYGAFALYLGRNEIAAHCPLQWVRAKRAA